MNFTDRSGKQKLSLAFSYDGFWAEDFSRKLSSFAAFHLFYDEQNKQYQIYDRGWKLLPLKEGERSESRRFIVEKQTYVCLEMDCYRVSQ
ncbi:MAG: hypothetical protein ACXWQO_03400 [Bdellovibrionota bacterium]